MTVLATKTPDSLDETREQPDIETTDTSSPKWAQPAERQTIEPFNRLHVAKVKRSELILFTTQLAVMLDSGVALIDALDAIAEQAEHGSFKMIIMNVAETIKSGENFSKALVAYPKVFNSMFISMVRASEASGKMVEMLRVLSGYLSFEAETRKQIKGALTYPFIMALMAVPTRRSPGWRGLTQRTPAIP